MLFRAAAFFAVVAFLGWTSFQTLVEGEVRRVVTVHVLDKSDHLVATLLNDPENVARIRDGRLTAADLKPFSGIAHATHVESILIYDPTGALIFEFAADQETDTYTHHSESAQSELVSEHIDHDHEGTTDFHPPSRSELRNLVDGTVEHVIKFDGFFDEKGERLSVAAPVLPIFDSMGTKVGFVGFVMDVAHIYEAYAGGVGTFGTLFMIYGIVLFGVPAVAFWLQKQLAERSSRNEKFLSRYDPLTGLLNRRAFTEEALTWLEKGKVGHAAYLDVDRFKLVNDTHGHAIGDGVLRHIAELMKARCDNDALIARFGGDEFTFLVPPASSDRLVGEIEALLREVATEFEVAGATVSTSISLGIAEPQAGDTLDDLLQRADTALYFAKAGGGNIASYYTEDMGKTARRRRYLEMRLRDALRNGDFSIAYQPLVCAEQHVVVGFEALLRLNDDDGVPVGPEEFIPLAEEIGLIEEIGTWVLRTATKEIAAADDRLRVSINLSAEQFRSGHLVSQVQAALKDSGLPPERLELEITESLLLEDDDQTALQIDSMKELGITLAMDDFGTGYSSLSTLWKYRFDRLKIDKSFVRALDPAEERSLQMIRSIISFGSGMGMSITVEGIETKLQSDIVVDLGCNVLQGFYFGQPATLATYFDRQGGLKMA